MSKYSFVVRYQRYPWDSADQETIEAESFREAAEVYARMAFDSWAFECASDTYPMEVVVSRDSLKFGHEEHTYFVDLEAEPVFTARMKVDTEGFLKELKEEEV